MVVAGRGLPPLSRALALCQGLSNPTSSGSYFSEGWQRVCWKEVIAQVASFRKKWVVWLRGQGVGKQFLVLTSSSHCWPLQPWANNLTSHSVSLYCEYPVIPKWKGFCCLNKQTWSQYGHQESCLNLPIMLLVWSWWSCWLYGCGSPPWAVGGDLWLSRVVLRLLTSAGYCLGKQHFAAVGVWPGQCVSLHTFWSILRCGCPTNFAFCSGRAPGTGILSFCLSYMDDTNPSALHHHS